MALPARSPDDPLPLGAGPPVPGLEPTARGGWVHAYLLRRWGLQWPCLPGMGIRCGLIACVIFCSYAISGLCSILGGSSALLFLAGYGPSASISRIQNRLSGFLGKFFQPYSHGNLLSFGKARGVRQGCCVRGRKNQNKDGPGERVPSAPS